MRELVRAFEEATVLPSQFHHCAHIAVALSYLAEASVDDATVRMRQTLQKFTQRHGVNVYHETVTRFWMKLLDHLATTHYRDIVVVAPDQFDRGTLGRDRPDCRALFTWRYQFARCPRNLDRAGPVAVAVLTTGKMPAARMVVLPMRGSHSMHQ